MICVVWKAELDVTGHMRTRPFTTPTRDNDVERAMFPCVSPSQIGLCGVDDKSESRHSFVALYAWQRSRGEYCVGLV